jgi:hypothetical protein
MHKSCVENTPTTQEMSTTFDIIPCNSFNKNLPRYSIHIKNAIKILLLDLLPPEILNLAKITSKNTTAESINNFSKAFESTLPFSHSDVCECQNQANVAFTTICTAHNTHGAGRHISEICSHWLVPGKQIPLSYVFSYVFSFDFDPQKNYLIHQINANLVDKHDVATLTKTLPIIKKEILISITAVHHSRKIISNDSISTKSKQELIYQNIQSLIHRENLKPSESLFDHMHHLFLKLSSEKKNALISEQMAPLIASNSKLFQRNIFTELQNFLFQFQSYFVVERNVEHVSKLVSIIYLFKKEIAEKIIIKPKERHLSLEVLSSTYDNSSAKPFVALLIGVNILKPNEVIAREHIEKALKAIIKTPFRIQFFQSIDKTNHSLRLLYFEIVKADASTFDPQELKVLQSQLAKSIKVHIKRTINPIFMAKNEEEILKNVITLSKQLKYVHDIPQVMINFHRQNDEDLIFTIIILRIKRAKSFCIEKRLERCSHQLKIESVNVKLVGYLRKKHQKQACIFDIRLSKKQFLQQDYSVDLHDARSCIYTELSKTLGQIRDFNGGMFSKQHEVFAELKNQTLETNTFDEFALKSFFYNISPPHMQGVLDASIFKQAFYLLTKHQELKEDINYSLYKEQIQDHFILLLNTNSKALAQKLTKAILELKSCPNFEAKSYRTTTKCLQTILIFRSNKTEFLEAFYQELLLTIKGAVQHNLNNNSLTPAQTTYDLFEKTKLAPNLMLNEHF